MHLLLMDQRFDYKKEEKVWVDRGSNGTKKSDISRDSSVGRSADRENLGPIPCQGGPGVSTSSSHLS